MKRSAVARSISIRYAIRVALPSAILCAQVIPAQSAEARARNVDPGISIAATPGVLDRIHHGSETVFDHGAKADCVTDDSAAWQRTIAALVKQGGGELIVPSGCSVISEVTIPDRVSVIGAGSAASLIQPLSINKNVLTIMGSGVRISSVGFQSVGKPQQASAFIEVRSGRNISIDHFSMTGQFIGILVSAGEIARIENGTFSDTSAGGNTVQIDGGNDIFLSQIVSDNNADRQPANGILVTQVGGLWIDNIDFIHSGNGLALSPRLKGKSVSWTFAENASFDSNTSAGITIAPASGATVIGSNFSNCWSSSSGIGVSLLGSGTIDGVSFINHRAIDNQREGLLLGNGTNISIDAGSQITGNSGSSHGRYSGINVASGVSGWTIRNSRIGKTDGQVDTQAHAIAVQPGSSSHYAIQNNDFRGAGNVPVYVASHSQDALVSGNLE